MLEQSEYKDSLFKTEKLQQILWLLDYFFQWWQTLYETIESGWRIINLKRKEYENTECEEQVLCGLAVDGRHEI